MGPHPPHRHSHSRTSRGHTRQPLWRLRYPKTKKKAGRHHCSSVLYPAPRRQWQGLTSMDCSVRTHNTAVRCTHLKMTSHTLLASKFRTRPIPSSQKRAHTYRKSADGGIAGGGWEGTKETFMFENVQSDYTRHRPRICIACMHIQHAQRSEWCSEDGMWKCSLQVGRILNSTWSPACASI